MTNIQAVDPSICAISCASVGGFGCIAMCAATLGLGSALGIAASGSAATAGGAAGTL
ncbi:hypothetical protein GCM10008908_25030 [Clostridium subterminale]|uniref:Bacteriocin n=1 Tax=Clostridium subterminale TaxID=1550 RepID=A0ABP3W5T7_CLOSU